MKYTKKNICHGLLVQVKLKAKQDRCMINSLENKTQYDWFPGKSLKLNEVKETKNDLQLSLEEEAKNSQYGQNLVTNGQILKTLEFPQASRV